MMEHDKIMEKGLKRPNLFDISEYRQGFRKREASCQEIWLDRKVSTTVINEKD